LVTVVGPVYDTSPPVRVVVAAPDWVSPPTPSTRASDTGVVVLRTISVPSSTIRLRSMPVISEPSPPRAPEPSRSTAPFSMVVDPS
jgi:hypothetical protein